MDDPETIALRQLTLNAVAQCKDPELLDLVYKLLIFDSVQ